MCRAKGFGEDLRAVSFLWDSCEPRSQLTKNVIVTGTILPVTGLSKRTGGIFNNVAGREVLKIWEIIINNIINYKTNTEKQRLAKK
jgi:hypothetical protein